MTKKQELSNIKHLRIQSTDLLKNSENGKYFPIRNTDPNKYLSTLRISVPHEFYNNLILEIEKYPYSVTHLLSSNLKKKINELESRHLVFIDFETEFSWAKSILNKSIPAINRFIELSQIYSLKLMNGQLQDAASILDEIEDVYGSSIWLIKNRIAFLQLTEGLEHQKKYAQSIKKEFKNGSLVRFIIHWISIRNENQTSVSRFTSQIESNINKLNPINQLGYKEYCKYHLLADDSLNPDDFIHVLRIENSHSIIDYYEAFVALLRILAINESNKLKSKVYNLLKNEKFSVIDQRIEVLRHVLGVIENGLIIEDYLFETYRLFLKGECSSAYDLAIKHLERKPDNPLLIIVGAYSKAMVNSTLKREVSDDKDIKDFPLNNMIINGLAETIEKGIINSSNDYNELSKISLNFSCFPWTAAIKILTLKENSTFSSLDKDSSLLALKIPFIHPVLIDCFQDELISNSYERLCLNTYGDNVVNNYYLSLKYLISKAFNKELSSVNLKLVNGLINLKNEKYQDAINSGEELKAFNIGYFIRRSHGLVSRSYLKLDNLKMACIRVSECYIYERPYYPFLPFAEILEIIKPGTNEWRSVNSLIDLSIVLDACVKHIDKKYEIERGFAYEDFLLSYGVEKPSQLASIFSKFDLNKLIYYLRFICIETTMDTSGAFEGGSQEVVAERLAICRLLLDIDSSNEKIYKQEIKDLIRIQIIASRRQEVDQSRIYVDIQKIKEWSESELTENYGRYITFLKFGLNTLDEKSNIEYVKSKNMNATMTDVGINTPDNEVNALLTFMVEEIRDTYLSADIGLDRFISTRIRHGDLERTLRSPLQKHNLITQKESKNGPYLRNDYWLNKLSLTSSHSIKQFNQLFAIFSESYDDLISSLKNEWLQIKKQSKPKGLFDFTIHDVNIKEIASSLDEDSTLQEFIDLVIRVLDSTLIFNLVNIRDELNTNAKSRAKKLLNDLLEPTLIHYDPSFLELQSEINQARTDIQVQFDKVIEWFVPSSAGSSAPYIIEDAMIVAEAIIKEANPIFKIKVEADDECAFSIHGQLPIFVDIFINIFENVVKRSGIEFPEAEVKIWTDNSFDDLSIIYFKVINKIGADIDLDLLHSELKRKKGLLQNGLYSDYLATEGNSGFFKIHKSVMDFKAMGFDIKSTMDFGIENSLFQITISIPFRVFVLESNEQSFNN